MCSALLLAQVLLGVSLTYSRPQRDGSQSSTNTAGALEPLVCSPPTGLLGIVTDRQADKQADRQGAGKTDRETGREGGREGGREKGMEDGLTDRQAGSGEDRRRDRQAEREGGRRAWKTD